MQSELMIFYKQFVNLMQFYLSCTIYVYILIFTFYTIMFNLFNKVSLLFKRTFLLKLMLKTFLLQNRCITIFEEYQQEFCNFI